MQLSQFRRREARTAHKRVSSAACIPWDCSAKSKRGIEFLVLNTFFIPGSCPKCASRRLYFLRFTRGIPRLYFVYDTKPCGCALFFLSFFPNIIFLFLLLLLFFFNNWPFIFCASAHRLRL